MVSVPKKTSQTQAPTAPYSQPPKSPHRQQPKKASALRLKRPIPAASLAKAEAVFKTFNLSKFAKKELPPNYVAKGKRHEPVQKQRITQKLTELNEQESNNVGMTVAIPKSSIQQAFPKLNQKTKTIDLNDLMNFIQQNIRGKQFVSSGNPTLNRLSIRAQVQQILRAKQGDSK